MEYNASDDQEIGDDMITSIQIPLHMSECRGNETDIERMRSWLEEDPDALERSYVNQGVDQGTPLIRAVTASHRRCVEFLLEAGAKVDAKNNLALCIAVCHEISDVVELLLKYGGSPDYSKEDKTVYLTRACTLGFHEIVRLLLLYGATPENLEDTARNEETLSPISLAASQGHLGCLKHLLLYGVTTDLKKSPRVTFSCQQVANHSLPHLILANPHTSVNTKVNMLRIFKMFGGNLWQRDVNELTALEVLEMTKNFDNKMEELSEQTQLLMQEPLSLKILARAAITYAMGAKFLKNYSKLELPRELINYLKYNDV